MNFFKRNLTKWIPLGKFVFSGNESIVFVRANVDTGEMFFKVKRTNYVSGGLCYPVLPNTLIDSNKSWEEINLQINS